MSNTEEVRVMSNAKEVNSFPQHRVGKYQLLVDWSFVFLQPFRVPSSRADSYVNEVTLSPAKLHEKLFSMEMWIQSLAEETLAADC